MHSVLTEQIRFDDHDDGLIRMAIGRHLRAIYDHVLDQPVPARFIEQLENLDARRRHIRSCEAETN